jgi:uncharacterized membrane protein
MKSKAVVLGHPIHPMLIPFPFALLTGAVVFDAAGWFRDVPSWWTTGGYLSLAGIATALLAAIPGVIDYLYTVPPNSSAKARATKHMLANLTAVVLFGGAWWVRGGAATRPDAIVLGLEVLGLGLLGAGGYLGGTLVTRNLIGVDHRYAHAGTWREETIAPRKDQAVTVARRDELQVDQIDSLKSGDSGSVAWQKPDFRLACRSISFAFEGGLRSRSLKGSVFRGWGGEVDGHENATLNQHRETAASEAGADEIEQGFPCLLRR